MRDRWRTTIATVRQFGWRDDGQDLLEYGLLISLIATFLIGAVDLVGQRVNGLWQMIAAAP